MNDEPRINQVTLRAIKITASLDDAEVATIVSLGDIEDFSAGAVVFKQGEPDDKIYWVMSGKIEIVRNGTVVTEVAALEFFGEMAMFTGAERAATARATEPSRLLAIPERLLQPLVLRQEPAAVKLVQRLGALAQHRMQHADRQLAARLPQHDPALAAILAEYAHLRKQLLAGWALAYHAIGKPGKLAVVSTKPSATAADLSVAYSPGVAEPCTAIRAEPDAAYAYTGKGRLVGVVSNGTAVLGLGAIGALAAKPVMEGKAVLFKRFAGIDAFDIEVDEADPGAFVDTVVRIAPTFGGINLEDIAAPACFAIEQECRRRLDIPVMHDDQHGTAISVGAAVVNALALVGKRIDGVKVCFAGAGAAGLATAKFLVSLGVQRASVVLADADGVLHAGRDLVLPAAQFAVDDGTRTLEDAVAGADVFVGLSAGGVLTPEMLRSMAADPIVLAMANPVPEIDPQLAHRTRRDVVMATGRSDYPNQVNNVLAFPYVFRGALDIRATAITEGMKLAACSAIAELARQPITDAAGFDDDLEFGRDYFVPKLFDRRLLGAVASAVAGAGIADGVGRHDLDLAAYRADLDKAKRFG